MNRTDQTWRHFDAAFAEMDKAFASLNTSANQSFRMENPKETAQETLRFSTTGLRARLQLARTFAKMTLSVLLTGKTQFTYNRK